jgi:hypothetical protein
MNTRLEFLVSVSSMETRVLDLLTAVAPNTISAARISHRLDIPRKIVNGILYTSSKTQRHVKTPLSHTDPHITWSLGTDNDKSKSARSAVNSRNKSQRNKSKREYEAKIRDMSTAKDV